MSEVAKDTNSSLEVVLNNCLKVPGVKVNRREFLLSTFEDYCKNKDINIYTIANVGPVKAGVSRTDIRKIATSIIEKRTIQSTGVSFVAGLPGGLAMAASIPADTLQFFAVALRLAQELAYIYGYDDMWQNGELDGEKVKNELTLFLGVMFGVSGASSALKVISANISKQMLKKLPQKALTKTIYYPIIKKIASIIGVKLTKQTFAKGVSKVVPVLGGVVSGGLTYFSMKPMGKRLRDTLDETLCYTEKDFKTDIDNLDKIIDIDFTDAECEEEQESEQNKVNNVNIADALLTLKNLLETGVLSQEEFEKAKKKLLDQ